MLYVYTKWPTVCMSFYLLYMFRYFKTTYSVHHPLEYVMRHRLSDFFKHPIGTSNEPEYRICPFGRQTVFVLVAFLCVRCYAFYRGWLSPRVIKKCSLVVCIGTAIFSFLNMNAFLYLIPYFILELGTVFL